MAIIKITEKIVATDIMNFKKEPFLGYKKYENGCLVLFKIDKVKGINNEVFFKGEKICELKDEKNSTVEDLAQFYNKAKASIGDIRYKFICHYFYNFLKSNACQEENNFFTLKYSNGEYFFDLLFDYYLGKKECSPFDYELFKGIGEKKLSSVAIREEKDGELNVDLIYNCGKENDVRIFSKKRDISDMVSYMTDIMERAESAAVLKKNKPEHQVSFPEQRGFFSKCVCF